MTKLQANGEKPVAPSRQILAHEMGAFLDSIPLSSELVDAKNPDFLFHFEAHRHQLICEALRQHGLRSDSRFSVLDFGYLHGLSQEFLHRAFPSAQITVCDRPGSPVFEDAAVKRSVSERPYLKLVPCGLASIQMIQGAFDVLLLGEVIEHIDPTVVATAISRLHALGNLGALLVITTPNAAGFYNCWMTMNGGNVQAAPFPDALVGYGHIHLWSPRVLEETVRRAGWIQNSIQFYHGREAEGFASINRHWVNLKAQLFMRITQLAANLVPRLRGFYVASFTKGSRSNI